MQNNSEPKTDDDIVDDDDFDLDDFDDDLADESWDEFDDDGAQESVAETDVSEDLAEQIASEKKSFFKKNFNVIVITIAVLGGGGAFLSQIISTPKNTPPPVEQGVATEISQFDITEQTLETPTMAEVSALSSDAGLPPMPAPINTAPEASADITELQVENRVLENKTLTPMPEINELDNAILAELNIEEVPAVPVNNETLEAAETQILEFDVAEELSVKEGNVALKPIDAQISEETISEPVDQILSGLAEVASIPPKTQEAIVPVAIIPSEEIAKISDTFSKQVQTLEKKLNNENNALADSLVETNNKIDTLVDSVSALEKKLEALATAPARQAPVKNTTAPAKPAEIKSMPVAAPKPAARKPQQSQIVTKPPKSEPTPTTVSSEWQLRSAQPGKALVAPTGSNDMRTVQVGDTLKGIGRITSIAIEDGKWIIRGTKGLVSQ